MNAAGFRVTDIFVVSAVGIGVVITKVRGRKVGNGISIVSTIISAADSTIVISFVGDVAV